MAIEKRKSKRKSSNKKPDMKTMASVFVFYVTLFVFVGITLISAQGSFSGPTDRLISGLNDLCISLVGILPIIAILLFVVAAVIYGIGNIFGAEMRSKATSWATTMIVGAIISLLIWVLAKPILSLVSPDIGESDFCTADFSNFLRR